jgi:hypothetical protein
MQMHNLRRHVAQAAAIGVAGLSATLMLGAGVSSAATPGDPAGGAAPVAPHFYNGNVEGIRDSGSDTTFFMMQKLGDYYTGAGLYGCTLNGTTGQQLFNSNSGVDTFTVSGVTTTNLSTTITQAGTWSSNIVAGDAISQSGNVDIPSGDTVASVSGSSLVLSLAATGTATGVTVTLTTPGFGYDNGSDHESFCASGQNVSTTDVNDNWDRTEVTEGVDDVGSGAGQGQLCGTTNNVSGLAVDFARSSKPASACTTLVETGYAKDGVPVIDYKINPSTITGGGTSTTAPYSNINGGVFGPVASGWLPGDSPTASSFSGTVLGNISNNDSTGSVASTAYRLWCASDATRITDWGALTNLGGSGKELLMINQVENSTTTVTSPNTYPSNVVSGDAVSGSGIPSGDTVASVSGSTLTLQNAATLSQTTNLQITTATKLAVGQGAPIGIPIRLMGVNPSSGTESTFAGFANSGTSNTGCSGSMNTNAALDPNPVTDIAGNNTAHIALENDSDNIDQYAIGDFPSPDYVDQAIEADTTLYIMSNGVFNTNPYTADVTIDGVQYSGNKLNENNISATAATELNNTFPTARTLFNIYRSDTVRASVGGFLNWICDDGVNFSKGLDNSTGNNFNTEVDNTISTVFGFPRLSDTSSQPTIGTPADNQAAPGNTCAATLNVSSTNGSNQITLTGGGTFPPDIVNQGGLNTWVDSLGANTNNVEIVSADFPANTFVVSGAGTSTLTLSAAASAGGTNESTVFDGVPSVTSVANSQS